MRDFARVVVVDSLARILVVEERSGFWNLPGGKVEPGEDASAAAIRETLEETGLEVLSSAPILERVLAFGSDEWRGHFFHAVVVRRMLPQCGKELVSTSFRSRAEIYRLPTVGGVLRDVLRDQRIRRLPPSMEVVA